ncbi:hypothetical protein OIO90_000190 [Microbotryomycetes sp. JL221]|nr:hypothetical protein OIO90_000190 [Microbotryomycetes sp. JL221]
MDVDPSLGGGPLPALPEASTSAVPAAAAAGPALTGDLPPLPGQVDDAPIALARPRRQRKARQFLSDEEYDDDSYMQNRHHRSAGALAPKIKLKIGSRKQRQQANGAGSSNSTHQQQHQQNPVSGGPLGAGGTIGDSSGVGWDRELDSDTEEPLPVEEQFILRVPQHVAPQLKKLVEDRNVSNNKDVWFKFKDSRRAVFHFKDKLYGAKLVDLPALIESQKLRGQGGATVKVADISQMLLVEDQVNDEQDVVKDKTFNAEDFIYPHGITAPLRHVRKRRFRKRHDKKTIELVEAAVEKLLEKDSKASQVEYELLDHDVPSDEDEYDQGPEAAGQASAPGAGPKLGISLRLGRQDSMSSLPDDAGRDGERDFDGDGADAGEGQYDDEDDDQRSEAGGSGYDSDLADEINKGMAALEQSDSEQDESGSDRGGLFGESGTDDDDDEEDQTTDPVAQEQKKRIKLLLEETGDLDRAIQSKEQELAKAANPIFKKRFEEMIKKLTNERDLKRAQHTKAVAELEKRQAAVKDAQDQFIAQTTAASNAAAAAGGSSSAAATATAAPAAIATSASTAVPIVGGSNATVPSTTVASNSSGATIAALTSVAAPITSTTAPAPMNGFNAAPDRKSVTFSQAPNTTNGDPGTGNGNEINEAMDQS